VSRATVRAAIVSTFTGITGLTAVYASEKKVTNGDEWYAAIGDRSGMLAFVFIEHEVEARRSLAGPSAGYKKISYDVALVCQFRHNGESTADGVDAGIQAIQDYDATIENLKAHVRLDRTLGGAVFQIGEGDTLSGDDIEITSDLPVTDADGLIHIWAAVKFRVIEFTSP
jgi:hypothetical protein